MEKRINEIRDQEAMHYYNEAQIKLMLYQKHQGIITSALQYSVYAKAFELLAHADLEGLRDEVEKLIQLQLNS